MATELSILDAAVRHAIYSSLVSTGRPPTTGEVGAACGFDTPHVEASFRRLAESHVVVLKPGTTQLWSAPPFSAVATKFRVRTTTGSWFAPCAWDMFGVPAALRRDADLDARCAWSGEPLPATVRSGSAHGEGVVHLEVPARHFWVDIYYT